MFDGEPIDEHTKEMIRISLENSMRMAKQLAKQKFTPNKYKKIEWSEFYGHQRIRIKHRSKISNNRSIRNC